MNNKKLYESIMKNVAKHVKKALNESNNSDITEVWDKIIVNQIATEKELQLITDINGYTIKTLNDVIYSRTGYHDMDQYEGIEEDEYDIY